MSHAASLVAHLVPRAVRDHNSFDHADLAMPQPHVATWCALTNSPAETTSPAAWMRWLGGLSARPPAAVSPHDRVVCSTGPTHSER